MAWRMGAGTRLLGKQGKRLRLVRLQSTAPLRRHCCRNLQWAGALHGSTPQTEACAVEPRPSHHRHKGRGRRRAAWHHCCLLLEGCFFGRQEIGLSLAGGAVQLGQAVRLLYPAGWKHGARGGRQGQGLSMGAGEAGRGRG